MVLPQVSVWDIAARRDHGAAGPARMGICHQPGLLPVGPLGIAAISRVNWKKSKSWRSYFGASVPLVAWALPVGTLLLYNWLTLGHFSGYSGTNESSGFSLKYFFEKWDFAVHQL